MSAPSTTRRRCSVAGRARRWTAARPAGHRRADRRGRAAGHRRHPAAAAGFPAHLHGRARCSRSSASTSGGRAPATTSATAPARRRSRSSSAPTQGEKLFGMGQRTHGRLDHKGLALDLVQRNAEVSDPVRAVQPGLRLPLEQPGRRPGGVRRQRDPLVGRQSRGIDYWVTTGARPGRNPEPLRRRHRAQPAAAVVGQRVLAVQAALPHPGRAARGGPRAPAPRAAAVGDRRRLLLLDRDGRLPVRPCRVARPAGHGRRAAPRWASQLMVSIWPTVSPLSENYEQLRDEGLLVGADQGVEFQQTIQDKGMPVPMPVAFYDPTNPRTREVVWDIVAPQLLRPRRTGLVARRLRARAQPRPPGQHGPARRPRRRGGRHLPAGQRADVRRGHGGRRPGEPRDGAALPLRLGRPAALRRRGVVR